jgi:hypothetical protein
MPLVERLRKASTCVYIAVDKHVADDLSDMLRKAADEIATLRSPLPDEIRDDVVDAALNAWFASPPSETDQGLERSMRAAIGAALKTMNV